MDFSKFIQNKGIYDYDLKGLVFYLISLFYKTDCKFECSKRKINRLLTIYKLCCNKNGYNCFEDIFYIGKPYPTYRELDFLERDIYLRNDYEENDEIILTKENLNNQMQNKEIPGKFKLDPRFHKVSDESKEMLQDIFIAFAPMKFENCAKMINEIMDNIPTISDYKNVYCIDKDKIEDFFENELNNEKFKNNLVFQFIKNYSIDKKTDFNIEEHFNYYKVLDYISTKFMNLSFENQKKLLTYLENLANRKDNYQITEEEAKLIFKK